MFQPQLKNPKHVGGQSFNCYVLEMEDNDEYLKYKMSTERVGSQTGDKPSMASLEVCKQISYRPEPVCTDAEMPTCGHCTETV